MILGVWLFRLDLPDSAIAALFDSLDAAEQARAGQFRFDRDRRRFVARRGQLRGLLADHVDRPARALRFEPNAFGKPALAGSGMPTFNLSSSAALGLCVVARGVEVGCDIERRVAALADPAVADRLFAPAERRALAAVPAERWVEGFFNCWTRKEAFVKALGTGLGHPLQDFAVTVEPDAPAAVRKPARGWSLHAFVPAPGYHAAIAIPRERIAVPPVCWLAAQDAFSPSPASPALSPGGRSSGAARFDAGSSISAALFSCAASSAVTPPTP